MPNILGEDYTVKATITDRDGNLITPASQSVVWIDPTGAIILTDNAPTNVSLGVYRSTVGLPAAGEPGVWVCRWTLVYSGADEWSEFTFWVKEAYY